MVMDLSPMRRPSIFAQAAAAARTMTAPAGVAPDGTLPAAAAAPSESAAVGQWESADTSGAEETEAIDGKSVEELEPILRLRCSPTSPPLH